MPRLRRRRRVRSQMIRPGPHQCRLLRTTSTPSDCQASPAGPRRDIRTHAHAPSAALLAPFLEVEPKLLRVARLHAHVPRQIAHDLHSSVQVLSKCDESIMNRGGAWVSYEAHFLVLRELGQEVDVIITRIVERGLVLSEAERAKERADVCGVGGGANSRGRSRP